MSSSKRLWAAGLLSSVFMVACHAPSGSVPKTSRSEVVSRDLPRGSHAVATSRRADERTGEVAVEDDRVLSRLRTRLPRGWSLTLGSHSLVIERSQPVWVLFENHINAPVSLETGAQREARVRAHGKSLRPAIVYPVQRRWSEERLERALLENDRLRDQMDALIDKYQLRDVLEASHHSKRQSLRASAPASKREAVEAYERDRERLQARVVEVPRWQTEQLALFSPSRRAWSDSYHTVVPVEAANECYRVDEIVSKTLEELARRVEP